MIAERGGLESAWLSECVLLVAGAPPDGEVAARTSIDGREVPIAATRLSVAGSPAGRATEIPPLAVCRLALDPREPPGVELTLEIGGAATKLRRKARGAPPTDLTALLRQRLSDLDPLARGEILRAILQACGGELGRDGSIALGERLKLVRDALREPLPLAGTGGDEVQSLHVEQIFALGPSSFWIRGWIWDSDAALTELQMVSPEGWSAEALRQAFRYRRVDIENMYSHRAQPGTRNGVISCFELDGPSRLREGWIAQLRDALGGAVEVEAPPVERNLLAVREMIIGSVRDIPFGKQALLADQVYPAVKRLREALEKSVAVDSMIQYGEAPADPEASVVIPLRHRLDALELQLAVLAQDPLMKRADLIYVLDSTERAIELAPKAFELFEIYRIPFRLVLLTREAGPTIMLNQGASVARARKLLFMSPDVVPTSGGWIACMSSFYDDLEDPGAVGPKLLFEDGSIQHAGVCFAPVSAQELGLVEVPDGGLWDVRSRFKGLSGDLPAANVAAAVPAVSGACLMVDRDLFESTGGLRGLYAGGDGEHADLCLRLGAAGRRNRYLPAVAMCNLDGRSTLEPTDEARQYDALLLTEIWRDRIAELDESQSPAASQSLA